MKKRTLFAIVIAILFMIIGGVGTFFTQKQLINEREENAINKKIPTKENKTLNIHFSSSTLVTITKSDDDNIYMNKQGVDFKLDKTTQADCTFTEEKDISSLTINNPTVNHDSRYPFSIINFNSYTDDTVYLRIPQHYEAIHINGENINLSMYDFSIDNMEFNISTGSISLQDVRANHISQTKSDTDFMIQDSKVLDTLNVNSKQYDINVLNTTAKQMTLSTGMGNIFTGNTKGELNISSEDGDVSINHTTGKSTITTKHGDILFHDDAIDFDTTLSSTNGDITIETDTSSIDHNHIDFETSLGDISIFNKNLSSERKYKTNKGKISIKATTKNGEIDVEELDSEDTHYGYD
ncbi:DUF4097 family beta strand repeat-containing protein [Vagococcus bubulae]|nr:DUF4097 family beta strand repeat-containing protein [Vagococcus bubulae]